MNIYSIVLYLHIVGALLLFVAMGMEFVTVSRLRSAGTAEQVRDWLGALGPLGGVRPGALGPDLVPGLFTAAPRGGWGGRDIPSPLAMGAGGTLGAGAT